MAISIDSLVTSVTFAQARDKCYALLESLGFPVTSWQSGAVARTIVSLVALLFVGVSDLVVLMTKSGFLDYATGQWLTLLAEQVYGVTRREATFATGVVRVDNTAGNVYTYAPFEVRVYNPATKKSYFLLDAVGGVAGAGWSIASLQTNVFVNVQAVEQGSASSAAATTVTAFETTPAGLTVTNTTAITGLDEQTDAEVRVLCRSKLGALSPNGPKLAYEHIAKNFDLNGGVVVNRTKVSTSPSTGQVTMYIAGPSGALSGAQRTLVETAILTQAAPQCIEPDVLNVAEQTVNVVQTVYMLTTENLSDLEVQTKCSDRLIAWFPTVPIEGYVESGPGPGVLDPGSIQAESARAVPGFRVAVTTPAAPVAYVTGQVAKLGTLTTNIVRVAA